MSIYSVGKIIKEARIRKNISQEMLCDGLCSTPTLSKIESCKQNPNKKLMEALLQRLGLPIGVYNAAVTEEEFKRAQLEQEIKMRISQRNTDIKELLEKYKNINIEMNALEKQFYLFMSANQKNVDEVLQQLLCALQQTIPSFELGKPLSQKLFTITELMILLNIGTCLTVKNDMEGALRLYYYIKEYFETQEVDIEEKSKQMPCILFLLANIEEKLEHYDKEVELAQLGIDYCSRYARMTYFDRLLYAKGYGLAKQGEMTEAKSCFCKAFTIMAARNTSNDLRINGLKEIEKEFGIVFSEEIKEIFLKIL